MPETARYDQDIVAWAIEQARLLRAGHFDELDIEHIAEEIEDVGKSEQREFAGRMAALLAHLIQWRYQPEQRGATLDIIIRTRRTGIARRLRLTPSLAAMLTEPDWQDEIWGDAVVAAIALADIDNLPETCPWPMGRIIDIDWLPSS